MQELNYLGFIRHWIADATLDVIEHIDEDLSAVKELNRILKPGGRLILTVPAFQFLWTNHDLALHHKKRYMRNTSASTIDGTCGK